MAKRGTSSATNDGSLPASILPRPKDVRSLDGIVRAMYDVISGPARQKRDWSRFRSLYLPGARFILAVSQDGETPRARTLDVDDYIRRAEPIFEGEGFWEIETSRETQRFGNIAHVLSAYDLRRDKKGKAYQRGVNSVQLVRADTRWWIATVMWNTRRG